MKSYNPDIPDALCELLEDEHLVRVLKLKKNEVKTLMRLRYKPATVEGYLGALMELRGIK